MEIFSSPKSKKFEISIIVKDHFGNPTNVRREFATDSSEELCTYWSRNNGYVRKQNNRNNRAATKEEVEKAVKEASSYADSLQQKRDNEEI